MNTYDVYIYMIFVNIKTYLKCRIMTVKSYKIPWNFMVFVFSTYETHGLSAAIQTPYGSTETDLPE